MKSHKTELAAHLALAEVAVGAFVHGFNIPFGGNLMSINQGVFLCRNSTHSSSRTDAACGSVEISGIASVLKSLSPAGQKLGPMLSIMMQGVLYSFGVLLFGYKRFGQMMGMMLLSLWAFIQPLITIWIAFGSHELHAVLQFYEQKQSPTYAILGLAFWYGLIFILTVKVALSAVVPFILSRIGEERIQVAQEVFLKKAARQIGPQKKSRLAIVGALKDLMRPVFLFSFLLTIVFWWFRESSISQIVWLSLRPLGLAFIIFYLLRSQWFSSGLAWIASRVPFLHGFRLKVIASKAYLNQMVDRYQNE